MVCTEIIWVPEEDLKHKELLLVKLVRVVKFTVASCPEFEREYMVNMVNKATKFSSEKWVGRENLIN